MNDNSDETRKCPDHRNSATEVNPLLQFLGHVAEDCHNVPVNTNVKRIVFSPGGGQLLQGPARASRMRLLASLAYLDCASTEMEADEAIAFLIAAPDNLILERVLAEVEGPGTAIAPGLKAALNVSRPLRALAIGILNRLLEQGCSRKAALDAASRGRHLRVRSNLQFADTHDLHVLTRQAACLCGTERDIIALDRIVRSLARRAPGVLPDKLPLRRFSEFSDLMDLLKRRILRYRGEVAVPDVTHPRLEWLRSVPELRAAGRVFRNCLSSSTVYPVSLLLGRSFVAIYTCDTNVVLPGLPQRYVLSIKPIWEEGRRVLAISEARGTDNQDMPGRKLFKAIEDLEALTGCAWRIDFQVATDDLLLFDWQLVME